MKRCIGVIGGGKCTPEVEQAAMAVGEEIARQGAVLICGGMFGVMEAACKGAKRQNGLTVGVLPGTDRAGGNNDIDIAITTGMHDARNVIIIRSSDAVIAIDGEFGTLSEIAFALKFGVPVISLGSWSVHESIIQAENPKEAVRKAMGQINSGRRT